MASQRRSLLLLLSLVFALRPMRDAAAQQTTFTPGNLVVVVEGCGQQSGSCSYTDNQGTPLTLFQYKPVGVASATYVNALVLPQAAVGANLPVSAEYGSSSEGTLALSGDGRYLTVMGYGINAATYNASPATYGTLAAKPTALAQSGSLTGQSYTPVARVVALVDANGNVNSTTGLFNVFNLNNPRSVYTADGFNAYVSGQGSGTDATGGVFYTPLGAINNAPTPITGLDTSANTLSQETRTVQIYNGTLYVSVDTKEGSNNARSFVGTLGMPPATSVYSPVGTKGGGNGPTQLNLANNAPTPVAVASNGTLALTASEANTVNSAAVGSTISLSASGFFFANAYTLYIADTGNSKQTKASSTLGDGGLQKWVNTKTDGSGTWQLQYTLSSGLGLVANTSAAGSTGLYAVIGVVSGATVNLYVTNSTIGDLDPTYLYGITDTVASTTKPATTFTLLATAPSDSNFKGVALAPSYPAGSATLTSVPSGLNITVAGTGCGPGTYATPVTLVWTPGATCTLSSTATQSFAGTPYAFTQWQDGTTSLSEVVTSSSTPATYTATFSSTYAPVGALEKAVDNTTPTTTTLQQGDALLVSGWVADPVDGSPLSNVKVYVDGTLFGTPKLGGSRPDVASSTGNAGYANSGYQLVGATTSLALGMHVVTVVAIDAAGNTTTLGPANINIVATPQVTVGAVTITQGTATATLSASVAYSGPVAPAGGLSFTVNGSSAGVGAVSCTGTASAKPAYSPATDVHLGDSITNCFSLSSRAQGYPYLLAAATNRTVSDYAINGQQAADLFPLEIAPGNYQVLSHLDNNTQDHIMIGTNDTYLKGTGAYETAVFQPALSAVHGWMLTPRELMVLPGDAGMTASGSCAATSTTVAKNPNGSTMTGAGCSGAGSITTSLATYDLPIYGWYLISDAAAANAAFTVTVDGVSTGVTYYTKTAPAISTQNATTATAAFIRIPGVTAGTHTIVATTTTGGVAIIGWGTPKDGSGAYLGHPTILSYDIPNQLPSTQYATPAELAAYSADVLQVESQFIADGLDLRHVNDQKCMLATPAEMNDALHPSAKGHQNIADCALPIATQNAAANVSPLLCTASYASSSLGAGNYSIMATEVASGSYNSGIGTNTLKVNAPTYTPQVTVNAVKISQGTATTTLSATVTYSGSTAPTGGLSFTVNGSAAGVGAANCAGSGSSLLCTATYASGSLSANTYTIAATEAADANYNSASGTGTLTVGTVSYTSQVSVSSASIVYGTTSTPITVTIGYTGPTAPSGGLTLTLNGGPAIVTNLACTTTAPTMVCVASLASSVPVGTYTVTATEASSPGYGSASGTGTLTVTAAPDFSFQTSGTTTQAVSRGSSASFTFSLSSAYPSYPGAVSFSVSGLPAGATSTVSPNSVGITGGAQTVTLTVQTSATAAVGPAPAFWRRAPETLLALLVLPLLLRRRRLRFACWGVLLVLATLTGCGGGTPPASTTTSPPVTATITVTAASGAAQHSAAVTLTEQ